jgi:hypothetical protein
MDVAKPPLARTARPLEADQNAALQVGEEGQPAFPVQGRDVSVLRSRIPGRQGTFVSLKFRRGQEEGAYFDVDLMRGSPEFIEAEK